MDLKVAGMSLVGNICRKFEAVCQEVDGIVNHDSFKYIENKVLNVGENVLRIYSELVQDSVPPIVDPARREAEAVIQLGTDEDSADTLNTQPTLEHVASEHVKNQFVLPSGDLEQISEQDLSVLYEGLKETVSRLIGAEKDINKSYDSSVNENAIVESFVAGSEIALPDRKAQYESWFNELANNNHEIDSGSLGSVNTCASSASSASDAFSPIVASSSIRCEKTIAELVKEFARNLRQENLTTGTAVTLNFSPVDAIILKSDSFSSSIDSCGNKAVEVESVSCSSSSFLSLDSYDESEDEDEDESEDEDQDESEDEDEDESEDEDEDDDADGDEDASGVHETAALIDSSRNVHAHSGSSENCSCETIDIDKVATNLIHLVKHEESRVVVDCSAVSCAAAQKLRSYKKKLQDALASKKKLEKEYEELAILHRNNAIECSQGSLPAPSTMSLDSRNSQTIQLSDSEWELL